MALSPADFYAYSRATGAPVPEDPRERAEMAPEVMAFRRNQLKAPESQGPDPLSVGIGVGLALAGAGGALFGARRLMRGQRTEPLMRETVERAQREASTAPSAVGEIVRDLSATTEPKPSTPPPTPSVAPSPTVTPQPTRQPMIRRHGRLIPREEGLKRGSTVEFSPRSFLEERGAIAPVEDLTTKQEIQAPVISQQSTEAVDTGLDQVIGRVNRADQIDTDFAKFSRDATRLTERHNRMRAVADQIWSFEEELENLGVQNTPYTEQNKRLFTAFDLRGTLESAPGYKRSMGRPQTLVHEGGRRIGMNEQEIVDRISAASNFEQGHPVQQMLLNPDLPTEKVLTEAKRLGVPLTMPEQLLVRGGRVGRNLTSEISPGARASMVDVPTRQEIDLRHRAATLYKFNTSERNQLLNLQIPLKDVEHLIPAKVRGQKSGVTYQNTEVNPGYEGSDLEEAYNVITGNYDSDYMSEQGGYGTGRFSDYEANAADYGDVEGPGGLVETLAFKERTKSGTTMVPGRVSEEKAQALVNETLRQQREIDVQIPTRSTEEGDVARGVFIDPETGNITLQGAAIRLGEKGKGLLQSADVNVEGSSLVGGFQPEATKTPAINIGLEDLEVVKTDYGSFFKLKPGVTKRESSFVFDPSSDVINVQPFMEDRIQTVTELNPITKQPVKSTFKINDVAVYGPLLNKKGQPTSVNRSLLVKLAADANDLYYNSGKATTGNPLEHAGFVADYMNEKLLESGIDLPVLRDIKAKHRFVSDVTQTTKDVSVYGRRQTGLNQYGFPTYASEAEPLPALTKITRERGGEQQEVLVPTRAPMQTKGLGGLSPMLVEEAEGYDVPVSFYTPRIQTAPQRVTGVETTPSTQTGALMSLLRSELKTLPVGFRPKSPGSFARTQNPYTGAAAAAMGPASRVSTGQYQYTPGQLRVLLEPTSQRQLQERNQFALAANLTPGGTVRQGALQLGGGLGAISAGIESLPSESATVERYGVTGGQLKQVGETLMSRAAQRRAAASVPQSIDQETIARGQATAQHLANYITSAAQRLEGPETWKGDVKLKGKGQNVLRPYQPPSEAMIQQLIRAYR